MLIECRLTQFCANATEVHATDVLPDSAQSQSRRRGCRPPGVVKTLEVVVAHGRATKHKGCPHLRVFENVVAKALHFRCMLVSGEE